MIRKNMAISFVLFLTPFLTWGQTKTNDSVRLKPPKLESFWGLSRGGNISLEYVIPLLDSSVKIFAEKKERFRLAKALLVYRSKDYYEDESTATLKTRYNSYSFNYRYNDQLPEDWKKFLRDNLKPGDQLLIADIHVKNQDGYLFPAPDIKINVE